VLFKELEGKSKYIETLQKRLVNGRAKEQAQISGLQADLDKTEADLVKANEAHKVTKKQVQDLMRQSGGSVVRMMNKYSSGGRGKIKHEGYPVEVRMLVMRLMGCGCSNSASRFPPCAARRRGVGQGTGWGPRGSLPDPAHLGPIYEKKSVPRRDEAGFAHILTSCGLWVNQVLPVGSPSYRIMGSAV
jgi:hypothetical protein